MQIYIPHERTNQISKESVYFIFCVPAPKKKKPKFF